MALFANIGLLAIIGLFIIGLPAIIGLLVIMLLPIAELPPATPNSSGLRAKDDLNGELEMDRVANGGVGTPGRLNIDPDGDEVIFEWK